MSLNQDVIISDLYEIQFKNPPSIVRLPDANDDNTSDIDLSTRVINSPQFLSVEKDHKSTVIYFKVDRYFDFMDLANTVCVIEYKIPGNKVPYLYVVPYFDIASHIVDGKIIFPWVLGNPATQQNGTVEYAIRFFRLSEDSAVETKIVYDLRTLPAKSTILKGMEVDTAAMQQEYDIPADNYLNLINQIYENKTYWEILD